MLFLIQFLIEMNCGALELWRSEIDAILDTSLNRNGLWTF